MFVLALVPLSLILRKTKAAYKFSKSKEKINHLLFMDDLKLYSRSEKRLDSSVETVCVFSEDIAMEFGLERCAMLVMEKKDCEVSCQMVKLLSCYRKVKVTGI